MTDTNGLDVLIAWAIFSVLLIVLGGFLLRRHPDVMDEANRRTDGTPLDSHSDNAGQGG